MASLEPRLNHTFFPQERHHKVVRRHVKDHFNTNGLERSLAVDLIIQTLRDLESLPIETGLVRPHPASKPFMRSIENIYADGLADVQTSAEARRGPLKIKAGDCVFFKMNDILTAGDICTLLSATGIGHVAIVTYWQRLPDKESTPEFWRFQIQEQVIQIPLECIIESTMWHRGSDNIATALCPPVFMLQ